MQTGQNFHGYPRDHCMRLEGAEKSAKAMSILVGTVSVADVQLGVTQSKNRAFLIAHYQPVLLMKTQDGKKTNHKFEKGFVVVMRPLKVKDTIAHIELFQPEKMLVKAL